MVGIKKKYCFVKKLDNVLQYFVRSECDHKQVSWILLFKEQEKIHLFYEV